MTGAIDHDLAVWDDIKDEMVERRPGRPGLLVGNGASRAVWDKFKYKSLFELACIPERQHCLIEEDIQIFREMDNTENFELVLSSLTTARRINEILVVPTKEVTERYDSIRLSLIQAVRDIHIPFKAVGSEVKAAIIAELREYQTIYTTNYDLLLYWCIMSGGTSIKDYFWGADNSFDLEDCTLRGETRSVLYLHGALHLYRTPTGLALKKTVSEVEGGLLDQFDTSGKLVPLIISEGKSRDKKSAILRNDYLAFAIRRFHKHEGNLVVFGQSLSEEYDNHLVEAIRGLKRVDAMRSARDRIVAISMHPETDLSYIRFEKARLHRALPNMELRFFDSTTHPLGSTNLRVAE